MDDAARETALIEAPDGLPCVSDDPFSDANLADPYPLQHRLREAGPVVWLSRYGFYAVARYEEAASVLSEWRIFSSARGIGLTDFAKDKPWREPAVLIEADPPRHNEIRARVANVLSARAVEALRADFVMQADALLDRVLTRTTFDAQTEIAEAYPIRVFGDALGIDEDRRELLLVYGDMGFNNFGPANDRLAKSMQEGARVGAIDWMMTRTRREALRPGSLGAQFHALSDDGLLTPYESWNVMRGQLTAGVDTTIATLGHLIACFADAPEQYALLRDEPQRIRATFDEAVRHLSPLQAIFRTTTQDTTLGGVVARADTKVMVSIGAANRDPRRWSEPDRFDVTRNTAGHLGFGRGVHVCVGMNVARLEAECLIEAFARRVARVERAGQAQYRLNNTVRRLAKLPVTVTLA